MTAARTGNVEAARVLLAHGARVDARESWRGQTALMWAAAQNHPAMVRELLAHGAEINARSAVQNWERQNTLEPREKWLPPGGLTPLLFAARQGSLESARVLVEAGADVNVTDPEGTSAVRLRHHQRPLRRRRSPAREGHRPEPGRQGRQNGAVRRRRHEHDAGVERADAERPRQSAYEPRPDRAGCWRAAPMSTLSSWPSRPIDRSSIAERTRS